jgi:hypothetical protein
MTPFLAILAFPMPRPNCNNELVLDVIAALDLAGCLVDKIQFKAHMFKLAGPSEMAMVVTVKCDHPFDDADAEQKETWLQSCFDVTSSMPDCSIIEIR